MTSVGIPDTAFGADALACGLAVVLRRRSTRHYHPMRDSYLGLLAATGAKFAVRVPGAEFTIAAVASLAVTSAGADAIARGFPVAGRFP